MLILAILVITYCIFYAQLRFGHPAAWKRKEAKDAVKEEEE